VVAIWGEISLDCVSLGGGWVLEMAADGYGWARIKIGLGALGLGWGSAFSGLGTDGFGSALIILMGGFYDAMEFYFGVLEVDEKAEWEVAGG